MLFIRAIAVSQLQTKSSLHHSLVVTYILKWIIQPLQPCGFLSCKVLPGSRWYWWVNSRWTQEALFPKLPSTLWRSRSTFIQHSSCLSLRWKKTGNPEQPLHYLLLTETNQLCLSSPTYPKTDRGLDDVGQTNNDLSSFHTESGKPKRKTSQTLLSLLSKTEMSDRHLNPSDARWG